MSVSLLRGNALALPLADASVDLGVTSPPYFGLRSYTDGGVHYAGQIGSEATPGEFVDALIAATAEMMRVLKPSGSIFVNLGDKYAASPSGPHGSTAQVSATQQTRNLLTGRRQVTSAVPQKSLMGLPWRYAIRCIDDLGLILRAEIIWSKPNGLPESVTDRVRRSHEQWFHMVKSPRYYSAVDAIREPHARVWGGSPTGAGMYAAMMEPGAKDSNLPTATPNPLGKLPGSVWSVPTQPLTVPEELGVDHFAAFPMEWPRRFILGWSPSGICTECGEGRRPITEGGGYDPAALARRGTASQKYSEVTATGKPSPLLSVNLSGPEKDRYRIAHHIVGEACACPHPHAPTRPAVVLDSFGGTGTTALLADVNGRHGISVDMSADYQRIARWRTTDPGQRAAALRVEKPPPVPAGTDALFDLNP